MRYAAHPRMIASIIGLMLLAWPVAAQVPVSLSPVPHIQFLNNNALPLANGCVFTYQAGTNNPAATYVDSTGTAQNTNPIILNAGGFADIWLPNAAFKFKVVSAGGVACASGTTQWTVDNISGVLGLLNLANTWTAANTFSLPVTITPNVNQLVLGTPNFQTTLNFPAPAGNVVVTMPNTTGTVIENPSPLLTTPIINGASTGTGLQGTDTKLLTSGTVSGTASPLCTDALGGATTVGCAPTAAANIGCTNFTPVTVSNTNAGTPLQTCTVAANALVQGSLLEIDFLGIESEAAGYTLTLATNIGGGTSCSTTVTVGAGNNQVWNAYVKFFVLTAGAGGTANMSCGYASSAAGGGVIGPLGVVGAPTISVNTTISNAIQVTLTMSVANPGNTVVGQGLKAVIF